MANFSIYSLISILIKALSESKSSCANTLANCVFPTPVWPKNINEPIGLLGSFNPALFRCIAFVIFWTASSWPITFPLILSGKAASFVLSVWAILLTGTPVIIEITSATLASETISLCSCDSFSQASCSEESSFSRFFSSSLSLAASSYFCFLTTEFFKSRTSSNCFSICNIFSGTWIFVICTLDPASSRASIALSGKKRSVM